MASNGAVLISAFPVTAERLFPYRLTAQTPEGLGVQASLGADSIWRLWWRMPQTIPSGTPKLRLVAHANATSGNAKFDPKWIEVNIGDDADAATPASEGTQTLSWAAGEAYDFKEIKTTLDVGTFPAAGEFLKMDLTFITASWTLAAISVWLPEIIWE